MTNTSSPLEHDVVFLVDVDNTLLDNDAVIQDLRDHLLEVFGEELQRRYWEILEELREQLGYVDYLGALQRYRVENLRDPHLLEVSLFLVDYPFATRLYPSALDVIRHLSRFGLVVILSDGDVLFQPRKVQRSGLWDAVQGRVLIYVHKEEMLDDVAARFPARHYVMVDDKLHILAAMKRVWGEQLTTIFPRQGHYAHDPEILNSSPDADVSIDSIAELLELDASTLTTSRRLAE
jgi:FMN phosphatase YigB (HAD superfamily)